MDRFLKTAAALFGGSNKKRNSVERKVIDTEKTESKLKCNSVADKIQDEMTNEKEEKPKNQGKLFVGGLNYSTASKELGDYFSRFGKVADAAVITCPATQRSRGFGFVTFVNPDDAEKALQTEDHVLDGRTIECRPFVFKDESKRKKTVDFRVFLGGLPSDITKEDLKQFFSRYGEVEDVSIPLDRQTKLSKGYAFLSFNDADGMEKCITDRFVYLNGKRVFINKADPRDSRLNDKDRGYDFSTLMDSESYWGLDSTPSQKEDAESTASGQGFDSELYLKSQLSFQKHFREKFFNINEMSREKVDPNNDIYLLEKFLKGIAVNSDGNLSEVSDGDDSSDGNESSREDDCGYNVSSPLCRGELCESTKEAIPSEGRRSDLKLSAQEHNINTGKKSVVMTKEGNFVCCLCMWKSSDSSFETFLDHCKSVGHRTKIRERFPDLQTQKPEPEPKPRLDGERPNYILSELRSHPKEVSNKKENPKIQNKTKSTQKSETVSQKERQLQEIQPAPKKKEKGQKEDTKQKQKEQKPLNPAQESKTEVPPKAKNKKQKPQNVQQKSHQESENQNVSNTNLKVYALATSMACIQPLPNGDLGCEMCKKIIPKASDFDILMKNAAQHLQSKRHLQNLLKTENKLKDLFSQSQEKGEISSLVNKDLDGENKKGKNPPAKKVKTPNKKKSALESKASIVEDLIKKVSETPKGLQAQKFPTKISSFPLK